MLSFCIDMSENWQVFCAKQKGTRFKELYFVGLLFIEWKGQLQDDDYRGFLFSRHDEASAQVR